MSFYLSFSLACSSYSWLYRKCGHLPSEFHLSRGSANCLPVMDWRAVAHPLRLKITRSGSLQRPRTKRIFTKLSLNLSRTQQWTWNWLFSESGEVPGWKPPQALHSIAWTVYKNFVRCDALVMGWNRISLSSSVLSHWFFSFVQQCRGFLKSYIAVNLVVTVCSVLFLSIPTLA